MVRRIIRLPIWTLRTAKAAIWQQILFRQSRLLETGRVRHTVVIAPHPDDETLACGGLIHQRVQAGARVAVVFLTDGSRNTGDVRLEYSVGRDLRAREALAALRHLGVGERDTHFADLPDGGLAALPVSRRQRCIADIRAIIEQHQPDDLLVPYRHDGHADHEAAWRLVRESLSTLESRPRLLEYLIWLPWLSTVRMLQLIITRPRVYRLAIDSNLDAKRSAIGSYQSQLTTFPRGFVRRFMSETELFLSFGVSSCAEPE